MRSWPHARRASLGRGNRTEIGDNLSRLGFGKIRRRHRRTGNAVANDLNQILIGRRAPEYAAAEVDARDLVAVRTVTVGARVPEHSPAIVDIGRRVVLRPGGKPGNARQQRAHDQHERAEASVDIGCPHIGNPRMSAHLTPFGHRSGCSVHVYGFPQMALSFRYRRYRYRWRRRRRACHCHLHPPHERPSNRAACRWREAAWREDSRQRRRALQRHERGRLGHRLLGRPPGNRSPCPSRVPRARHHRVFSRHRRRTARGSRRQTVPGQPALARRSLCAHERNRPRRRDARRRHARARHHARRGRISDRHQSRQHSRGSRRPRGRRPVAAEERERRHGLRDRAAASATQSCRRLPRSRRCCWPAAPIRCIAS